jgi:dUTP pyrophosphatase
VRIYYLDGELRPERAHEGDAGIDLKAAEDFVVLPKHFKVVPTGIRVEIEPGLYGQVLGRSGLAKMGIMIMGGVIDRNYRGEIMVQMANYGENVLRFRKGDRIAQLVCIKIDETLELVQGIPNTDTTRGENGFGSSGLRNGKYSLEEGR